MYANLINGPLDGETAEFFKPLLDGDKHAVIVKGSGRSRSAYQFTGVVDGEIAEFRYLSRLCGTSWKEYKRYVASYQPLREAS